jgi:hypothetical protein
MRHQGIYTDQTKILRPAQKMMELIVFISNTLLNYITPRFNQILYVIVDLYYTNLGYHSIVKSEIKHECR